MNLRLVEILLISLINTQVSISIQYNCDKRNISCGCGFKNVEINEDNLIPEEIIPYSWSMVVSIRFDCNRHGDPLTHCCIGTILNEQYILTSAQCFDLTDHSSLISGNITIAAGAHDLSRNRDSIHVVDRIVYHPNWTSSKNAMNNIAILHLAEPLDFNNDFLISRACVSPSINNSMEMILKATLAVVGWNFVSNSMNKKKQVLQQLTIYPVNYNDSLCSKSVEDTNLLFCAGRDGASCFAEIGSPLFQWIGDRWQLIGIESYDMNGCSSIGYKGLFVRLAAHYDWIYSISNLDNQIMSSTTLITTVPITTTSEQVPIDYKCNRNMPCGCSYTDVVFLPTRIVGGQDAADDSWLMIVSLRFSENDEHFCAGTLLSNSYVLTAAHCVEQFLSAKSVNITIAASITNRLDSGGYRRNVKQIRIHPNYIGWPNFLNNIALLQMDRPLESLHNPLLAKTCIHSMNSSISTNRQHPKNGTRLAVIGWGAIKPGSFLLSASLKQVQINAIDEHDQICKDTIIDSAHQFCAGSYNNPKDACLGDSGGPIFHWTGEYWEQVGIIGYNFYCGRIGHPGIYTRLSYYWEWMENILNQTNEHVEPSMFSSTTTTTTISPRTTSFWNRTRTTSTTIISDPTTIITNTHTPNASIILASNTTTQASTTPAPTIITHSSTPVTNNSTLLANTSTPSTTITNNSTQAPNTSVQVTNGSTPVANTSTPNTTTSTPSTTITKNSTVATNTSAQVTNGSTSIANTSTPSTMITNNSTVATTSSMQLINFTYACDRIPNECGCSQTNVVSYFNQQPTFMNRTSEDAYPHSWSMIVSIRMNNSKHTCIGTILSDLFVLTAAHCVLNSSKSDNITIATGIYNLSTLSPMTRRVVDVYVHDNYTNDGMFLHDIAILRLEQALELETQSILSKTCLPHMEVSDSSPLISVGWMHVVMGKDIYDRLQQAPIKHLINSNSTCFQSNYFSVYQFCAGLITYDTNECEKNYGEPVFVYRDKYWEQVGILSKAYGCRFIGHSGVYTRLSAYIDWIQVVMQNTSVPIRRPPRKNVASKFKQTMLVSSVLAFIVTIFY